MFLIFPWIARLSSQWHTKLRKCIMGKRAVYTQLQKHGEVAIPESSWHLMWLKREMLKGSWVTCDQRRGWRMENEESSFCAEDFKILSLCTYRASGSIGQRASSLVKIQAVACSRKCPLLLPLRTYPVSTYEVPHPMSGGWADEESPFL